MRGVLKKQRIAVAMKATGTSGSGWGEAYGTPVVGDVRRIDWSGTGLGSTGWFKVQESGVTLSNPFITGSESATPGDMDWNDSCIPLVAGKKGDALLIAANEGSAYGYYPTVGVPHLIVSGCQSGTALNVDIYWEEMR